MSVKVEIYPPNNNGDIIRLLEDLEIWGQEWLLVVPAGFESDGASVPRFLWSIVSPVIDHRTIRAALAHDYIYREHPVGWSRKLADELFYRLCREDGLSMIKSTLAYHGIRIFGGNAWNEGGNYE